MLLCYRDAEKRALQHAKLQKQEADRIANDSRNEQHIPHTDNNLAVTNDATDKNSSHRASPVDSDNNRKAKTPPRSPNNNRPASGGAPARYPGSILANRDPVYNYHKRERDRKRVSVSSHLY